VCLWVSFLDNRQEGKINTGFSPKSFVFLPHIKKLNIKIYKTWSLTLREEHRLRVFENSAEEDIWT
jgi:hypothetical protein